MLPFLIIAALAGTAAVAADQRGRDAQIQWLRERLRLKAAGLELWRFPIQPGIPVRVWADGHRIVRTVTPDQLEAIGDAMPDSTHEYWDDAMDTVANEGPPYFTAPTYETRVFAYLDQHNRPLAMFAVQMRAAGSTGTAQEALLIQILGPGDDDEVTSRLARLRMHQLFTDLEVEADHDEDQADPLFYNIVVVEPGIDQVIETIETYNRKGGDFAAHERWKASLPSEQRDYTEAYETLEHAWSMWVGQLKWIEELSMYDADGTEFFAYVEESGRLDEMARAVEVDLDDLEAIDPNDSDAVEAFWAQQEPGIEQRLERFLWSEVEGERGARFDHEFPELLAAIRNERDILDGVMLWHVVGGEERIGRQGSIYRVPIQELGGRYSDPLLELDFTIEDDNIPRWPGSDKRPGFYSALRENDELFTLDELDAEAGEPAWVWPGDTRGTALLVDEVLGNLDTDVIRMPLRKFLQDSNTTGLLPPHVVDYWANDPEIEPRYPRHPV